MANTHVEIPFAVGPRSAELQGLDLGDKRRNQRGKIVFESWASSPESSLPQAMKHSAELEGAYRFFSNVLVDHDAVLAPHITHSWERAQAAEEAGLWVLAVQDTTEMRFGGTKERHGLGDLMNEGNGFYVHPGLLVCLAESSDSDSCAVGVPLGVGGCEIMVRSKNRPRRPENVSKNAWARERHFAEDNEFLRWNRLSKDLDEAASAYDVKVIHVADREADEFSWMTEIKERGGRFVVRQTKDRRLVPDGGDTDSLVNLNELLSFARPTLAVRKVSFETATTRDGGRRRKQARKGRTTTLTIYAVSTSIRRPGLSRSEQRSLDINVVVVREQEPPEGQVPIEWRLITTEPIDTPSDVLRVVDAYRARWLIEEYFKAIKTGCNYERLQLETLHGLKIALSLVLPMAWHMLLIRTLARDAPNIPASAVMTKAQFSLLMLVAAAKDNPWAVKLPDKPTTTDVMYAIARMGGHLKNNGPPGWQTLGRGFRELEQLVRAQQLFLPRSDQS